MKRAIYLTVLFVFAFFVTDLSAQDTTANQSDSNIWATLKINGISPTVGITHQIDADNRLRALAFININSSAPSSLDAYHLNASYLRDTDWVTSDNLETYWGINISLQFEDPVIGPGILAGVSYNLSENFAVFGEAGFNVYVFNDADNVQLGLLNSGVGLRLAL